MRYIPRDGNRSEFSHTGNGYVSPQLLIKNEVSRWETWVSLIRQEPFRMNDIVEIDFVSGMIETQRG